MSRWKITYTAIALAVLDIALLLASGIPALKNAKHGLDYVLGELAWLGFLVGTLGLLVTVAIWITRSTRQRRTA
jgi:predicted ferric reductase